MVIKVVAVEVNSCEPMSMPMNENTFTRIRTAALM